jgi:hypothetical protein
MKYLLMTILILNISSRICHSCDCIMYPIEWYIDKVDIIFTGKVVELLDKIDTNELFNTPKNREFYKDKAYMVKVLVLEKLKTGKLKSDTLEFVSDFSNCDPIYELGETYLFFADKTKDRKFKMTHCTYWGKIEDSKENIEKLKSELKK